MDRTHPYAAIAKALEYIIYFIFVISVKVINVQKREKKKLKDYAVSFTNKLVDFGCTKERGKYYLLSHYRFLIPIVRSISIGPTFKLLPHYCNAPDNAMISTAFFSIFQWHAILICKEERFHGLVIQWKTTLITYLKEWWLRKQERARVSNATARQVWTKSGGGRSLICWQATLPAH